MVDNEVLLIRLRLIYTPLTTIAFMIVAINEAGDFDETSNSHTFFVAAYVQSQNGQLKMKQTQFEDLDLDKVTVRPSGAKEFAIADNQLGI